MTSYHYSIPAQTGVIARLLLLDDRVSLKLYRIFYVSRPTVMVRFGKRSETPLRGW